MKVLGYTATDVEDISINGVFMSTGHVGKIEIMLCENDKEAEQFSIRYDFYVDLRATTLFIGGKEYSEDDLNCHAVRFGVRDNRVAVVPYF